VLVFNSVTVVGLGKGRGILIPVFFFSTTTVLMLS